MSIEINEVYFENASDCLIYLNSIRNAHFEGEKITDEQSHEDLKFVYAQRQKDGKIPLEQIDHFQVNRHPAYPSKCFFAVSKDGQYQPFSIRKLINEDSLHGKFSRACRTAVELDLKIAKRNFIKTCGPICEITSMKFDENLLHLDHMHPFGFSAIVTIFRQLHKVKIINSMFSKDKDHRICFANPAIAEQFRQRHNELSRGYLRLIHKDINLSDANNHRISKAKNPVTIDTHKPKFDF